MRCKTKYIFIALFLMIIGSALLTSSLIINGAAKIASLEEDFDVYFSDAILDGIEKSNQLISGDRKTITFETRELKTVNDSSKLEFEVTNNSTQYDAHVEVLCVSNANEYITLTTSRTSFDIIAQSRERDDLTITLNKLIVDAIDKSITCSLYTTASSRTSSLEKVLEDSTYQITGTLQDEHGNILEGKNLVVYSEEPHYVTTDNFGFFYVTGLEKGVHEIYYVGEEDVTSKSKTEIKALAIDETEITTNDISINFDDIKLDEFVVEPVKTGKVDINFDSDGGSETNTQKVDLYTKASDLPIPTKPGNIFKGWYYNGKPVNENTIINDEKSLRALWDKDRYTITIDGSGFTADKTSIEIEYEQNASVTITPNSGMYIESVTCDGGYTTTASVGTGAYLAQAITIKSNGNPNNSVCNVTVHTRNYAATATTSTYSCNSYYSCHSSPYGVCDGGKNSTETNGSICPTGQPYVCRHSSTCTKTVYSCPNGGTLSGTTCVF